MLSTYLLRFIEGQADALTAGVITELQSHPQTPSYHQLTTGELRAAAFDVYHGFSDWVADANDAKIEARFATLGRQRFLQDVPLSEQIFAVMLAKERLREKIREVGSIYSALELHNELHLNMMISRFFDKLVYAIVKGYEEARDEAGHTGQQRRAETKSLLGRSVARVEWVP